ncbi:glycoside hydrolase family 3 C-terminal domain-containing protein [Bifidobacterium avesanii]|uniref:Glycosyl hydrolase n=1 Tax=Bifidobacterium avesanii TaxID=1798157 RepID=A0A7K3THT8_9BIFI|nr:glycoside hydrolase family 3 C-terminal domain-containing protein [Bifidobacterium avesanii]KAB8291979.1 glycosyl hydrolase [Bifidobacterium avesanii]NEG78658.1 glycosyl hydrolase [Bifidobacterium avesanii]
MERAIEHAGRAGRADGRAERAIERLSLIERAALLAGASQWTTHAVPRADVPAMVLSDGPHGLRREAAEPGAPTAPGASLPATCFPTASAVACSWDPDLAGRMGAAIGDEARAQGVNVLLGPGMNVKRSPLCGRNFEYYAEDPLLAGRMGAGFIRGVQSRGVAACPKHFAANGQELRRQSSNSVVDGRTLRELYLTAFEIAVREARPWALMSSYNRVNGVYAHENRHLLTDVLRGEWGFDGMVVSDWGASNSAVAAAAAGGSLEMPCPGYASVREVVAAVRSGRLGERALNDRAREVARCAWRTERADRAERIGQAVQIGRTGQVGRTGRAAGKYAAEDGQAGEATAMASAGNALTEPTVTAHHAVAREVAEQSMVLLRNEGGTLPFAEGTRVALVGDMAVRPRFQGSGSSKVNATRVDALFDVLEPASEGGLALAGYAPGYRHDGKSSQDMIERACALVERADVDAVVACVGLDDRSEAEGLDRATMRMPQPQLDLMDALADACERAGKPLVAVLAAGSPVLVPWAVKAGCAAILYTGLAGQAGASAVARILSGRVNPSGRLAETWPLHDRDVSTFGHYPASGRDAVYREGPLVGYRHFTTADAPVRYPFGFGLGYAAFRYSDLAVDDAGTSFMLTNTSAVEGAEAAQLYVSGPDAPAGGATRVAHVARELKGFAKVRLKPGESRRVTIPFDRYTFRHWDLAADAWAREPGEWRIMIGSDCMTPQLEGAYVLAGSSAPVIPDRERPLPVRAAHKGLHANDLHASGQGVGAPGPETGVGSSEGRPAAEPASRPVARLGAVRAETARALRMMGAPDEAAADRPHGVRFSSNDPFSSWADSRSPIARWWAARLERGVREAGERLGAPDLDALFRLNMPPRALAKLSDGSVDAAAARALADVPNGHALRGGVRFALAVLRNRAANRATVAELARYGVR